MVLPKSSGPSIWKERHNHPSQCLRHMDPSPPKSRSCADRPPPAHICSLLSGSQPRAISPLTAGSALLAVGLLLAGYRRTLLSVLDFVSWGYGFFLFLPPLS